MGPKAAVSAIEQQYVAANPTSRALYEKAVKVIPGGSTHDMRHLEPFLVYIQKANGPRKWDVDGHEYIDYVSGHGALILGHENSKVIEAVSEQLRKSTHYGANSALEVEWAELVTRIVPSAEKVRFTSSGTEATMMAFRLCRAFTGKTKILRFEGHFHGWHDVAEVGGSPPFDVPDSAGIPKALVDTVVIAPNNDPEAVDSILRKDKDIACVVLEPSGGTAGQMPLKPGFLKDLRDVTNKHGVILFFDEVITGFRWAPGGAQERFGVTPDITSLAKILAGGLNGGAVAGRAEILDMINFRDSEWNRFKRVPHPGTYNANPLAASSGVACLKQVANPEVQRNADAMQIRLLKGLNDAMRRQGVPGIAYGESSAFHVFLGADADNSGPDYNSAALELGVVTLMNGMPRDLGNKLHMAWLLNGSHINGGEGWVSTVHTPDDIDKTISGFEKAVEMVKREWDF